MKKATLLTVMALSGTSVFAAPRVAINIGIGVAPAPVVTYVAPPPPPVAYVAPAPAPGFVWVAGYWNWAGARYVWVPGRWARPPYRGAAWAAPRYVHGRFYGGYWRR